MEVKTPCRYSAAVPLDAVSNGCVVVCDGQLRLARDARGTRGAPGFEQAVVGVVLEREEDSSSADVVVAFEAGAGVPAVSRELAGRRPSGTARAELRSGRRRARMAAPGVRRTAVWRHHQHRKAS